MLSIFSKMLKICLTPKVQQTYTVSLCIWDIGASCWFPAVVSFVWPGLAAILFVLSLLAGADKRPSFLSLSEERRSQLWLTCRSSVSMKYWWGVKATTTWINCFLICMKVTARLGFPGGWVVKNPPASAGDSGLIPGVRKMHWRRKWQPTPVFLSGKSHGQRSLVGYSPWGHSQTALSSWPTNTDCTGTPLT